MRFQRLDFLAFGPFTGLELDLSGGAPGGFHLIVGPNEAGKSSALRGVHDLLFGFPERTPDAHVHPNAELRIRATLVSEAGETVSVQRLKRRKDALRDAQDLPLDERVMSALLGGVDAQLFERLFGLDHERLQQAGDALLEDRGDVGESLFDAGSGGRGIRGVLEALERSADEIFKPRSSKASLNVLLEAYKEGKSATRDALVAPEKWLAQQQQLEAARARLAELAERRKRLREESNQQSRLDAVLGPIAQRNALREKLDALGRLPILPEDASELRVRAQRTVDDAAHERARLEREVVRKRERLAELVVPENLLGVSGEAIEKLRDRVGKFRAAQEDLPQRREKVRLQEAALERLIAMLYPGKSLDGLDVPRPSPIDLGRVRKLPPQQAALQERVNNTSKALRSLAVQRAQANQALADLPLTRDLDALGRVLAKARALGDVERRVREALRSCEHLEAEAQMKLSTLGIWRGELDALVHLPVPPPEAILRFQREFEERALRFAELERDQAALTLRLRQSAQKVQAIEGLGSVPSEAVLAVARARRDDGLRRVFSAWARGAASTVGDPEYSPEGSLAEGFEQAVRAADDHSDRLRREAERVSLLSTLAAERGQLEAELASLRASGEGLRERAAAGEKAWLSAWQAAEIEPAAPSEMQAWLLRQRQLVELSLRLRNARREVEAAREEQGALTAELEQALGQAPSSPATLGALLAACEERVASGTRALDKRTELLELLRDNERQQAEREQQLQGEREALATWAVEWRAATARLGLDSDLSPDEVVTLLDSISSLFEGLVQLAELRRRPLRIEEERFKFEADVSDWIETYAPDLLGRAADVAAEELVRRFQAAELQRAENAVIQADLGELKRTSSALESRTQKAESELDALCAAAGASDLVELTAIEARVSEARGLQRQLDAVEGSLLKDEGRPLEALLTAARGVERASLQVQLRELEEELTRVDDEHQDLSAQIRDLDAGLLRYADTDAADRAQALSVQAAEIREQALRYARLRLSKVVLQREVERYREANQGPVLRRASALFPRLTLGSFRGLRVGAEERQIVALREDGKEVSVDGLSEGTRYQLYLALRIATLERYLERNPPLPLVLDDILIHFDDERARAALAVLGELADRVQVLFFTHHARDLTLAESAIEKAKLFCHRLTGPSLRS